MPAASLPISIRYLLESAIRNCDNFQVTKDDVEKILDWKTSSEQNVEIPFKPARVLLQVSRAELLQVEDGLPSALRVRISVHASWSEVHQRSS